MIMQCTITQVCTSFDWTNIRRVLVTRNSQCLTPAVRLTVFV